MSKYEFKAGDRVRRAREGSNGGMNVGDFGIVKVDLATEDGSSTLYMIKEIDNLETSGFIRNFDLVTPRNLKDLKVPTHLVIWDEDKDPVKFFTSDKEARDFIKTLIDKTSVKKDSIVLIEIKSAFKIEVEKKLKSVQYKIY